MIQESIDQYPGKCPCPYSIMSNGKKCGKRSAYSKPGGYQPLCYVSDITGKKETLIQEARKDVLKADWDVVAKFHWENVYKPALNALKH